MPRQTIIWIIGVTLGIFVTYIIYQNLWTEIKDNASLAVGIFFALFWLFRYLVGHKMYWLTCGWDRSENLNSFWKKFALHDWKRIKKEESGTTSDDLISAVKHLLARDFNIEYYLVICKRCDIKQISMNYAPNANTHQPTRKFEEFRPRQARFKWTQNLKDKYSTLITDIQKNAIDAHLHNYMDQTQEVEYILRKILPALIAEEIIQYMDIRPSTNEFKELQRQNR